MQAAGREHAEDINLWLPSAVDSSIRDELCMPGLSIIEDRLWTAQCYSALESICYALQLKTHMCDFRNKNSRGQCEGLRSRVQIDRIAWKANSAAHKYRAACTAKSNLVGPGSWEQELQLLLDSDIRSYTNPDLEANRQGKKRRRNQPLDEGEEDENIDDLLDNNWQPAGESRRVISWIWRTSSTQLTGEGEDESG